MNNSDEMFSFYWFQQTYDCPASTSTSPLGVPPPQPNMDPKGIPTLYMSGCQYFLVHYLRYVWAHHFAICCLHPRGAELLNELCGKEGALASMQALQIITFKKKKKILKLIFQLNVAPQIYQPHFQHVLHTQLKQWYGKRNPTAVTKVRKVGENKNKKVVVFSGIITWSSEG